MLAGLADGEEVKVEGELLHVAVEAIHLAVAEDEGVVFLLFLEVVLHVNRVFEYLPGDVELGSISSQELGLLARNLVAVALEVGSCDHYFP